MFTIQSYSSSYIFLYGGETEMAFTIDKYGIIFPNGL